jgi:AraC-like DNA-binding protein
MAMGKSQPNTPTYSVAQRALPPAQTDVPHRLRLSGRGERERDRFEIFRENFSRYLYPANVENSWDGTFDGGIELLKAGSVGISKIVAPPSTYARSRRHLSDYDDSLTLFIGLSRGPAIEQGGVQHVFQPGSGFLYHGAIPGGCEAASPFQVWGIKVEADRLRSGLVGGNGLKPIGIHPELPAMKLITQYLNSYSTVADSLDPKVHEAFGTHLADLLTLLVGADRDVLELIKGRGLKAARTEAVLQTIERDFASPDLSAESVGLALGITARQVHRLLEETTKTFYEHVLERRLIESRQLLTDPASASLKIGDIATRTGFVDRSHFHRVFRMRFGDTPSGVREAAAREHAWRFI